MWLVELYRDRKEITAPGDRYQKFEMRGPVKARALGVRVPLRVGLWLASFMDARRLDARWPE